MKFLQKLITKNGDRFFYIQAIAADKRPAWYFLFVPSVRLAAFENRDRESGYKLSDYGEIVESGYGETAPQNVIARINREYDCEFV